MLCQSDINWWICSLLHRSNQVKMQYFDSAFLIASMLLIYVAYILQLNP